jgi:hypothetical protein
MEVHLRKVVDNLPDFASADFIAELDTFFSDSVSLIDILPEALLCSLFLKAIKEHYVADKLDKEHLYLKRFEIPQIQLFDILITEFPFVAAAHSICNNLIYNQIANLRSSVILDVGIGRGIQMEAIINQLQKSNLVEELTIVGIEPFPDAILHARDRIGKAAKHVKFKLTSHFINGFAEDISADEIENLLPSGYNKLIVNSSLALHHIPTVKLRVHFFDQMMQLKPDTIILTEPNSDHMTSNWKQRVKNAFIHYQAIFETIDTLNIDQVKKNGLKMFFGREIEDVIGFQDMQRVERHQPCEEWIGYLNNIGMKLETPIIVPPFFDEIKFSNYQIGVLMMSRNEVGVLSIIAANKP